MVRLRSRGGREASPGDARAQRRRRRRWPWWTAGALAVLLVAAGAVTYRLDLLHRPHADHPSATPPPARIPPPAGLTLPAPARSLPPVAAAASPLRADPSAVRRAVDRLAASRKLGPHVVVRVAQLADGRLLYRHGSGPVVPASTMKLLTMVAALATLGPDHRFTTSVVATPQSPRIVLVGGGDPLLARTPAGDGSYPQRADLDTLAASTARALRALGRHTVRLGYDASLFAGSGVDRYWEPSYLPDDVVSPISALWVDEGRERTGLAARTRTPARAAAEVFARALERRHIKVRGTPARTVAPTAAHGGRPVARVRSAPLAEIVQHIVEVSDNEGAEVLAHQVAVAQGRPATFAGAAVAVRHALGKLAISTAGDRIYDGSGLSRDDRLRAATLLSVIRTASSDRHPGLRSAVADLPVAGFTGSLAARFDTGNPLGLGRVRAKTGTLTGVHGLAGTVTTRDGVVLEFVAVADRVREVNTLDARARLDELAAALAGCACRATP